MATAVVALAAKTPGKESMAMEAFARALLQLPVVIADNAGYDSAQLVTELRAAHSQGKHTMGLSKKMQILSVSSFGLFSLIWCIPFKNLDPLFYFLSIWNKVNLLVMCGCHFWCTPDPESWKTQLDM